MSHSLEQPGRRIPVHRFLKGDDVGNSLETLANLLGPALGTIIETKSGIYGLRSQEHVVRKDAERIRLQHSRSLILKLGGSLWSEGCEPNARQRHHRRTYP